MEEEDEWSDGEEIEEVSYPSKEEMRRRKRELQEECGGVLPRASWPAILRASNVNGIQEGTNMSSLIKKILNTSHTSVIDVASSYQEGQKFLAAVDEDIFYGTVQIAISGETYASFRDIVNIIKAPLTGARAYMNQNDTYVTIQGDYKSHPVLMWVLSFRHHRIIKNIEAHDLKVEIMAHPDILEEIKEYIRTSFEKKMIAKIKWWTSNGANAHSSDIYLPPINTSIMPEFYPDMGDPDRFISDYLVAEESVLLLAGPPGTGKTTLLRHMISQHKLRAHVIYDEALMQKDSIFQTFLFDEDGDIMIIEDADTILSDRERSGNKMMSRFLNVSDGLIKLPNKKLVFTTNIADFSRVDPALLRPGRCFGVLHTRALTLSEAQAAAKVAGKPIPLEKREYTIAEIFNQGKGAYVRSLGFGVRH